jgi:hypothetical protein
MEPKNSESYGSGSGLQWFHGGFRSKFRSVLEWKPQTLSLTIIALQSWNHYATFLPCLFFFGSQRHHLGDVDLHVHCGSRLRGRVKWFQIRKNRRTWTGSILFPTANFLRTGTQKGIKWFSFKPLAKSFLCVLHTRNGTSTGYWLVSSFLSVIQFTACLGDTFRFWRTFRRGTCTNPGLRRSPSSALPSAS